MINNHALDTMCSIGWPENAFSDLSVSEKHFDESNFWISSFQAYPILHHTRVYIYLIFHIQSNVGRCIEGGSGRKDGNLKAVYVIYDRFYQIKAWIIAYLTNGMSLFIHLLCFCLIFCLFLFRGGQVMDSGLNEDTIALF